MEMIHLLEKRAQNLAEDTWNRSLHEPDPTVREHLYTAYNTLKDAKLALERAREASR